MKILGWRKNDGKARYELVDLEGDVRGWVTYELVYDNTSNWDGFQELIYKTYGTKLPEEARLRRRDENEM